MNSERMTLKLYRADTGLLVTHCFDENNFAKKMGTRYIIWSKDLKIESDIIYIPIYMTMFL